MKKTKFKKNMNYMKKKIKNNKKFWLLMLLNSIFLFKIRNI